MSDDERRNRTFPGDRMSFARSLMANLRNNTYPRPALADAYAHQTSTRWRRGNADVPSGSFLESRATGVVT